MNRLQRGLLLAYLTLAGVVLATDHVFVVLSLTESLPERVFIVIAGRTAERGELVAYRWHGGAGYPQSVIMVKRRAGLPGDRITLADRLVLINDVPAGRAKAASRRGVSLATITAGVIPPGRSYVAAPHPDSLDSRYALTGLIADRQLIGRAYAIF